MWAETRGRAHRAAISSIVGSGLAIVGLYLGLSALPGASSDAPLGSDTALRPIGSPLRAGDVAQFRNETRRTTFSDPSVAALGQTMRYRLQLANLSDHTLQGVRVQLAEHDRGSYAVVEPAFSSLTPVRRWPQDTATVNFDNTSGPLTIESDTARLTDENGNVLRRLPTGIAQAGVNIGDLEPHVVRHVEVLFAMPPTTTNAWTGIAAGDILRARNVTHNQADFSDPIVATRGDRVLVAVGLHAPGREIRRVGVRATVPTHLATFARVKVVASDEADPSIRVTDAVTVNFARGVRLRLRPVYGTTDWLAVYGHDDACPQPRRRQLDDGIEQGGIVIGPVGYSDLDDDCSETTAYVHFQLEAVR